MFISWFLFSFIGLFSVFPVVVPHFDIRQNDYFYYHLKHMLNHSISNYLMRSLCTHAWSTLSLNLVLFHALCKTLIVFLDCHRISVSLYKCIRGSPHHLPDMSTSRWVYTIRTEFHPASALGRRLQCPC